MLTMKDIAKAAQVSGATVSRVINNSPHVKELTRKKVLETIEELNYHPNSLARGMRINKTYTIGLLVANLANPFYAETAKVIVDTANQYGYTIILCITNSDKKIQKGYIDILQERKVDGFLFASVLTHDKAVKDLIKKKMPYMLFNRRFSSNNNINYIVQDNTVGMHMAVEHLIKNGHTRIAFIRGNNNYSTAVERLNGYKIALEDHGLIYDDEIVVNGDYDTEKTSKATKTLLSLNRPPTAIVASNDLMALSAIEVIITSNLRVPEDIAVIGYDDVDMASHSLIQLTTVAQNKSYMADIAVQTLIRIIEKKEPSEQPIQIILNPKLVVRKTCGATKTRL